MAYPYDPPAPTMDSIWNSGSYTPEDMVVYIRDNYTPVNKTSMRNSVGYQISLVQNFVNEQMLGREELPVQTGYIYNLRSSGYLHVEDANYYTNIYPEGIDSWIPGTWQIGVTVNGGFNYTDGQNTTHISRTGFYAEYSHMAALSRLSIYQDAIRMQSSSNVVSLSHNGVGGLTISGSTLNLNGAEILCNTPHITLSDESSRIERIYNKQGSVTLSTTAPAVIDTGIDHLKNVSLVYFAIHRDGGTQLYQDNWIPANYVPYPSGIPLMTDKSTLNTWVPPTAATDGMQYGVHMLQKGSPSEWHIVISAVNSLLTSLYGTTVQYRYTLISFD